MKTKLFQCLTILFLTGSIFCFSQSYIPLPDSNAVWHETYSEGPNPWYWYNGIGDTYIEGDTLINDTLHRKLYSIQRDVFCSHKIILGPDYIGAYRNDTIAQKVYYIPEGHSSCFLLYDFSLQIGDTIPTMWNSVINNSMAYLQKIDTITTSDGVMRRKWIFADASSDYIWAWVIEGIGCSQGIVNGIGYYYEYWNELLCCDIENHKVWQSPWHCSCNVPSDTCITDIQEVNEKQLKIKPNPAKDFINISGDFAECVCFIKLSPLVRVFQ